MFYSGFNIGDKVKFRSGITGLKRMLGPFGYKKNGVFVVTSVEDTKDYQVVTVEGISVGIRHYILKKAWKHKN
jgi:hypothetical protein